MTPYKYDAFLSFAVEDKESIASPLYEALIAQGLNVWYSGREFQLGMSIKDQIKEGLEQSRYGILLITPHYFQTNWAQKELGALWGKEREDHQVIIPVFHEISPEEVGSKDPDLAERWSVLTSKGVEAAAEKIHQKIILEAHVPVNRTTRKRLPLYLGIVLLVLLAAAWRWLSWESAVPEQLIRKAVEQRIIELDTEITNQWVAIEAGNAIPASQAMVRKQIDRFNRIQAHFRNYYEFDNGYRSLQFEKNVAPVTGIDFQSWSPVDDYGFTYPRITMSVGDRSKGADVQIFYFNTQPVQYTLEEMAESDQSLVVTVRYEEPFRLVKFHYEHGPWTSYRKHTTYQIQGFQPTESYHFVRSGDEWTLVEVK